MGKSTGNKIVVGFYSNTYIRICKVYICTYIQVRGIGTALKILFSDVQKLKLRRTEIVALFNALGR